MSPNYKRYLKRCLQRPSFTEQNQYIIRVGRIMMGKIRKCTNSPQIAQDIYLFRRFGCKLTIPLVLLSSGFIFPWAYPPKQKYKKVEIKRKVIPSQLPLIDIQITKGFKKRHKLRTIPPLTLFSPFLSANILKKKQEANRSNTAKTYLPKFWSIEQDGDMINAKRGLQRYVCRLQGLSQRDASRYTLQSRSVTGLNFPQQMLLSHSKYSINQILIASPNIPQSHHVLYMCYYLYFNQIFIFRMGLSTNTKFNCNIFDNYAQNSSKNNVIFYIVLNSLIIISTMPRVASNHKQKNKKFKGSTKSPKKAHPAAKQKPKTKGIAKVTHKPTKLQRIKQQKQKKQQAVEKLTLVNEYLDQKTKNTVKNKLRQQSQMRIVLLVPCNEHADITVIMNAFMAHLGQEQGYVVRKDFKTCTSFPAFQVFPSAQRSPIKNKLFVIGSNRDTKQLLDLAKCADIVCPVVSLLSANPQRIVEDPFNYAGAFDEAGYTTINMLRSLGLPRVVGLIQHIQKIEAKNQDKLTKFYKRFLTSQFNESKSITLQTNNDIVNLFRTFDSCGLVQQPWKTQRGYILADQAEINEEGNVAISGFLKGSCINPNQLVHITGLDDFLIEKIEILTMGAKAKLSMEVENANEQLTQFATIGEDLNPFSKPQAEDEDLLSAIKDLQIQQEEPQAEMAEDEVMGSEASDSQADWVDEQQYFANDKAEEKAKRVEMHMRKDDELQFEDQVEYAAEQLLRQKFREYQGLRSFKTSQWNKLQNLPSQYDRIFFFKNYNQTHNAAIRDNLSRGFAYPGFYVKVTIKDLKPEQINTLGNNPLVLSFLLKHERKMTVLHGKVEKNAYYQGENPVNSNELVMVSVGFKRLLVEPIYSRLINGAQKTKYTKTIKQDYQNHYFCSFYHYNYFPPSPFLVFRVNKLNTNQIEPAPILKGELSKCDPMHIILERIILTGYPYKINRRRSTIRYMFFNPSDVKYFKPVEIKTRNGLRGKIEQSLGLHGLMKCFFNQQIKDNDTVCMHLYRRVYPPANF